jgi:hypothetical protein
MLQVLSAYGREGLEAIIIVTILLAKAGTDVRARRDVWWGAISAFLISTTLLIAANGWADDHIFARVEGYSGSVIGVVICGLICYHAYRQHSSIGEVGFAIAFTLVSIESFEIGLQTLGVAIGPRLVGIGIAVVTLGLFFGLYRLLGKKPPTTQLQRFATLVLGATALWLISQSFDVLREKNDVWFGQVCLGIAGFLLITALASNKRGQHTANLKP